MNNNQPKITILVPSYNHAPYIEIRIKSILNQSYSNFELFVIDDQSSDNSNELIRQMNHGNYFRHMVNEANSGSPFSSWEIILALATGDYIWICESDDFAEKNFLEKAVESLRKTENVVLFYCNSWVVDEAGKQIDHTDTYFHDVWKEKRWDSDFVNCGLNELHNYQIRGQTVPNMSSALISTEAFRSAFKPFMKNFKLTGDWLFIGYVLLQGNVVFSRDTLNNFRKHPVTSRAQVDSARSQAEFIITKYLLFIQSHRPVKDFAIIMRTDVIRFLYEKAKFSDVLRELISISPIISIKVFSLLFVSMLWNYKIIFIFLERYREATGRRQ